MRTRLLLCLIALLPGCVGYSDSPTYGEPYPYGYYPDAWGGSYPGYWGPSVGLGGFWYDDSGRHSGHRWRDDDRDHREPHGGHFGGGPPSHGGNSGSSVPSPAPQPPPMSSHGGHFGGGVPSPTPQPPPPASHGGQAGGGAAPHPAPQPPPAAQSAHGGGGSGGNGDRHHGGQFPGR
jgi:hypothetical protein